MSDKRSSQVATGIFLIGLALIFLLDLGIWPLIMFVIAAALLGAEYAYDRTLNPRDSRVIAAIVVAAIGLFSYIDLNINWGGLWPVILIVVGLYILFGDRIKIGGKDKRG